MSLAIQNIISTKGWEEVEEIFSEEILNAKKLSDIKTEDKTNEQLGQLYRSRQEAAKLINKILGRIRREGTTTEKKFESFK
jgi:hypothetical protein